MINNNQSLEDFLSLVEIDFQQSTKTTPVIPCTLWSRGRPIISLANYRIRYSALSRWSVCSFFCNLIADKMYLFENILLWLSCSHVSWPVSVVTTKWSQAMSRQQHNLIGYQSKWKPFHTEGSPEILCVPQTGTHRGTQVRVQIWKQIPGTMFWILKSIELCIWIFARLSCGVGYVRNAFKGLVPQRLKIGKKYMFNIYD